MPFFRYSTPCLPKAFPLCTVLRYPFRKSASTLRENLISLLIDYNLSNFHQKYYHYVHKLFKHLKLPLIINYNFAKSTIIIIIYSIFFSFYWVRVYLIERSFWCSCFSAVIFNVWPFFENLASCCISMLEITRRLWYSRIYSVDKR